MGEAKKTRKQGISVVATLRLGKSAAAAIPLPADKIMPGM